LNKFSNSNGKAIASSDNLRKTLISADNAKNELQKAINSFNKDLEEHKATAKSWERKYQDEKLSADSRNKIIKDLNDQVENLKLENKKGLKEFHNEYQYINHQNLKLQANSEFANRELNRANSRVSQLESVEIPRLKRQLSQDSGFQEKSGEAEKRLQELQPQISQFGIDKAAWATEKAKLIEEKEDLQKKMGEGESAKEQVIQLRLQLQNLQTSQSSPMSMAIHPRISALRKTGKNEIPKKRPADEKIIEASESDRTQNILSSTDKEKEAYRESVQRLTKVLHKFRQAGPFDFDVARLESTRCLGDTKRHLDNIDGYFGIRDDKRTKWCCLKQICCDGLQAVTRVEDQPDRCKICLRGDSEYCVQVKTEHSRNWFRLVRLNPFGS